MLGWAEHVIGSKRLAQPLAPKVVNVGRLIRGEILFWALGEAVEVETIVAGGLWNTLIDPGNVENALLNLAINARDAMEGRGKLTIEAGNSFLDAAYANSHTEVTAGQYVLLAVTDTGCGMSGDVIENAFEPFRMLGSSGVVISTIRYPRRSRYCQTPAAIAPAA